MNKEEIIKMYQDLHSEMEAFLPELNAEEKKKDINGKWSVLQNLDHLNKVFVLLNRAVSKPKLLLRWAFGKPNRPGRNYEALVARYHQKAQGPAVAPEEYRAQENLNLSAIAVEQEFKIASEKFIGLIERKWSDKQLDKYLLVHPLLGKLTIREMLYFVHWHTKHHFSAMQLAQS